MVSGRGQEGAGVGAGWRCRRCPATARCQTGALHYGDAFIYSPGGSRREFLRILGGGAGRLAFFLLTSARAMGRPPPVRIRWRGIGWRRCWGTGWQSPVCRSSARSVAALEGWVQCEAVVCIPVDDRVSGARVGRAQCGPRQRELGRGPGLGRDWGDVHALRAAELWAWGCDAWGRAGQGHGQPLAWA